MCIDNLTNKNCHDIALNENTCRDETDSLICKFSLETNGYCLDPVKFICKPISLFVCYLPQSYYCQDVTSSICLLSNNKCQEILSGSGICKDSNTNQCSQLNS